MIIFDLETDGLLDEVTKIHSLVLWNSKTNEVISCANQPGYISIDEGVKLLTGEICGHNILAFDIPVIEKLYPDWQRPKVIYDTLVVSRLIYTNLHEDDLQYGMEKSLRGKHKLEAWGKRLKCWKGDYDGGWENWSADLQKYCVQDVMVTRRLYDLLNRLDYSQQAIDLEHEFALIMIQQERNGVPFNSEKAEQLYTSLSTELESLKKDIEQRVPEWTKETIFIPKRDDRVKGYIKGVPFTKKKQEKFNPGSRKQILRFLNEKYQWTPDKQTKNGNPSLDHEVMGELTFPEAKLFSSYLETNALMGKIKTAKGAWLKFVKPDGRIHGYVNSNGAVTGRCTHSKPNLANVPSHRKFKGTECRSLFEAPPGMVMVGCDASGIELRMLAHYLQPYDGGSYAEIITKGDVHTANQEAAQLNSRDLAKKFIYTFLYGAGDEKIGATVAPDSSASERKVHGARLKQQFLEGTPGLGDLIRDVKRASKKGYLVGLDGRKLYVRSEHAALNTLLQSAGGLVMKKATCLMWDMFDEYDMRVLQALNVHDENQVFYSPEEADIAGGMMKQAIIKAGNYFNLRCPLDAEYNIGDTWAETH